MPNNLLSAVSNFDDSKAKKVKEYFGILGLPVSQKTVNVPNRNGYVYVRLRDNESEIIQARNEEVSPVWGLPVVIVRQGNGWIVKGRDIERYGDWGSDSSFLPAHHYQHEFNPDTPGGDVVFVYPQAFVPLLITPSGTDGGPNVIMQSINFKKDDGNWLQAGVTGTSSLLIYKPTDGTAIIGLAYLNRDTGNPGFLINSGSAPANTVTGTHDLLQYLPDLPSNDYEPLAMIRMVSGTESIGWSNLYDIRQFFGGTATGTGGGIEEAPIDGLVYGRKDANWVEVSGTGGGAGTPAGSNKQVQINQNNAFGAFSKFTYDYVNNVLVIGDIEPGGSSDSVVVISSGTSPSLVLWNASDNNAVNPFITAIRYRGSFDNPQALDQFDEILQIRARGHNGTNLTTTAGEILFDVPYDWASGSHPTQMGIWLTASGTAIMQEVALFTPDGINLPATETYNISGSPHTHNSADLSNPGGTYTPTLVDVANITSSVVNQDFIYQRVGSVVTVCGSIQAQHSVGAGNGTIRMSLPVASNLSTSYDCNGNGTTPAVDHAASIVADTTNNDALFVIGDAVGTSNNFWRIVFMYQILP